MCKIIYIPNIYIYLEVFIYTWNFSSFCDQIWNLFYEHVTLNSVAVDIFYAKSIVRSTTSSIPKIYI